MERLSAKQEAKLLQDLTDMLALVIAYQSYVKSIGKEDEAKAYVKKFMIDASDKASKKKV